MSYILLVLSGSLIFLKQVLECSSISFSCIYSSQLRHNIDSFRVLIVFVIKCDFSKLSLDLFTDFL